MYREITRGVQIEVTPSYLPERSSPEQNYYYFAYQVRIKNLGEVKTKLLSRHWIITDGNGQIHEVNGPGVVGEQPELEPGQEFEYTSFCPLPTPRGNMRGSYHMLDDNGERYDVRIPLFFLRTDVPVLH